MLLRETGFLFGGIHSYWDMGLQYVEKDGHIAIPDIKRNAYQIAGQSGTVLLPGEAWQPFNMEGSLYPVEEPPTQAAAQRLLRRVAEWLSGGRKPLIYDYEPEVFYLAELSAQTKWTLRTWFGGELQIRFVTQPFAYNVQADEATETMDDSGYMDITVHTGRPAPLQAVVENTGTAPITSVLIGSGIDFSGLNVTAGQKLEITCETPMGAVVGTSNALPKAVSFAPTFLQPGENTLQIGLGFGSGTRSAKVTIRARGRW